MIADTTVTRMVDTVQVYMLPHSGEADIVYASIGWIFLVALAVVLIAVYLETS